ncbi:MAG: gfo [Sphingomonas bacterium]|nr:Gfo/Idh/MocA family oxidoreductase [Sphingomonas bacterium]MDB5688848.1 gfo [Sphingomonas bacterium]
MRRPRIGFLGVGWIGRSRMQAMIGTGLVDAVAIAEPSADMAAGALELAPGAVLVDGYDALLDHDLDGVVIATPSALHADQSIRALDRGCAVFCQKPLGRTAAEAAAVVAAARAADRLVGVDFSYRFTEGMRRIRQLIAAGELGRLFAVDLVFHNAYGPDKAWFYDPAQSGGGCVMDLGVHLVDLALWTLGFPDATAVTAELTAGGEPLAGRIDRVEDHAVATIRIADGPTIRLACSWRLHAGRDAVIAADFYGTDGGAAFRNVGGSFYDFTAERFRGTQAEPLAGPPDDWGGRAAADWATRLAGGARFEEEAARLIDVSRLIDRIYGR